jgi:serine/threonine protein phosphatase PrpC
MIMGAFGVETLLQQGVGRFNEDTVLVEDNLFGVFDGASSLDGRLCQGRSGAWWAAQLARHEFAQNDASLLSLARRANQRLKATMADHGVESEDGLQCWSTSAAVFRINAGMFEWVQTGDCLIVAVDRECQPHLLTPYINHDSETLKQLQLAPDESHPQALHRVRGQIENVRMQMNREYGVLNGDARAEAFFARGRMECTDLKCVLAFSDGLFPPTRADESPDFEDLAERYLHTGLSGVAEWVREQERNDPDCREFPRFKPHDDISAVAVSLRG